MKRRVVIWVVAVVLLVAAIYFWGPGSVPAGQPALISLSHQDQSQFQAAFDANTDVPRLVLLVSPT